MRPPVAHAHLGVGWAFPVKPVNGRLAFAHYEDDVEQAIDIILLTAVNERVMLPEFGAGLRNYVFEPNSSATHRSLEREIRRVLTDWEPRITLEDVRAIADEKQPNLLLIHVDYVVQATNTAFNRVFPFYLQEGGS